MSKQTANHDHHQFFIIKGIRADIQERQMRQCRSVSL